MSRSGAGASPTLPGGARAGLLAAFVLSGAAGLVYQVAWQRALTWVFGVDLYATTTVVACFLLGLGLGMMIWLTRSR